MAAARGAFKSRRTLALAVAGACVIGGAIAVVSLRRAEPLTPKPVEAANLHEPLPTASHDEPPTKIPALIVPVDAERVTYERGFEGSYHLSCTVAVPYPASSTFAYVSSRLEALNWSPLEEDWLNPGLPSSHIRGWGEFINATITPRQEVRQWKGQWEDAEGNLVDYSFKYYELHPGMLVMNASWFPAESVARTREWVRNRAASDDVDEGL